ncbi:sensor histidine kinase [Anaerobacillus sp. MEB173]|uniref:sensor histidine kinase n=1 Tax=Anaerobacillus sp. MEB173 TaxID=3383345 RepID=UPI003F93D123
MSYKQIKWLILLLPTITVGLWEYIRHEFLLDYISMEVGNWLTPVIVFGVTMVFAVKLFNHLEHIQAELEKEKSSKLIFEEREKLSRELHDGIAQSFFLLSVKMNQLETKQADLNDSQEYQKVKKTIHHIHEDVRQSIFNLRHPSSTAQLPWTESLAQLVANFETDTGVAVHFYWRLSESKLSSKEKVELYACMREALMNIRKHAKCNEVTICAQEQPYGWYCNIEDDGVGFEESEVSAKGGYGLGMIKDRAKEMGWTVTFKRNENKTIVHIRKGELS